MAEIKHLKVVASLPSPLEPDSIYYVRVGLGYDQYVTNGVGVVVAYEANSKLDLEGKVDKESGKQLSDENYTLDEKNKLASLENYDDSAIQAELDTKVDKVVGKGLSTEDFTSAEKGKLAELENFDDSVIQSELDTKVDKVVGKELSTNDFTDQLRDKLASLEGSHFRGTFPSKVALESSIPTAVAGDYADVDEAGQDAERYIWDSSDSIWVLSTSKATPLTAAQIKQLYESNPDTNSFDDAAEVKLEGIADGATANRTDAYLLNRANHTGTQEIGTVAGLTASLSSKADQTSLDAVDASKVDKEEGKGLSANDFTTAEKTKLSGIQAGATANATNAQLRDRATHTGVQPISSVSGLQTELGGKASTTYVNTQLATKVDKVVGKELSSNDFTDTLKDKLEELENFDDSDIQSELDTKVDKVVGKGLSDENYTLAEKNKLGGIQAGATANATDAQLRARATHTGVQPIASVDGLQDALDGKVDDTDSRLTNSREWTASAVTQAEAEAGTSTTARKWTAQRVRQAILGWWNTSTFKTKLDGIEAGATKNATDAQLRSRATHTGVQPISSVTNLQSSLDSKVDKQSGYGLSQENYTPAEKSKLSSLEGSKFKGEYTSLAALQAAQPSPEVGSYAYVDAGVGEVVSKYIWDSSDEEWAKQQGETASLTPAEVKSLYEENPDTNAFTDSEKSKLSGIQAGATSNATNAQLRDRATHTGAQPISSVSGLQSELDDKADTTYVDTQLGDKVDKTVSVVAGTGLSGGGTLSTNRTLNVQYGTTAGTAAQGNDSRINNGQTAYGWGNHASAGYVKTNTTYTAGSGLSLTGTSFNLPVDIQGTGTFVQSVEQTASGIKVVKGTPESANATTATRLATARTINGTSFDGSANITTTQWGTARTLTIGSTGKSVNGSSNVTWTLAEIGAADATGVVYTTGNQSVGGIKTFTSEIRCNSNITAYYSDRRLKANITPIKEAILALGRLTGVTYQANDLASTFGYDPSINEVGLIAQEVQAVLPEAIAPAPFDTDADGASISGENYLTIKYEKLVPLLVAGINELADKYQSLDDQLDTLKTVVADLSSRL